MNKPDFIYVGYPRTGSSWIFQQLIKHSKVFLPFCKEIDFYWGYGQPPKGDPEFMTKRIKRYRDSRIKGYSDKFRDVLKWKRVLWDLKFVYGRRSPKWYYSLFPNNKMCGDISPNMAFIGKDEIRRLYSALPDIKIILTFREPIDQLWSAVMREIHTTKYDLDAISDETLSEEVDRAIHAFPRYHECYENWFSIIPHEQIYFSFFEDAMKDPAQRYTSICQFLDLEPETSCISIKPVGGTKKFVLTDEYEQLLVDEFRESVEILHQDERFDLPSAWYKRYPYLRSS